MAVRSRIFLCFVLFGLSASAPASPAHALAREEGATVDEILLRLGPQDTISGTIQRDRDGLMYLIIGGKIVTYDGVSWAPLPLSLEEAESVRSFALADNGSIYACTNQRFGRIEPRPGGQAEFIALDEDFVGNLDRSITGDLHLSGPDLFIVGLQHVGRWEGGRGSIVHETKGAIIDAFTFRGRFYILEQPSGLLVWSGTEFVRVPGSEILLEGDGGAVGGPFGPDQWVFSPEAPGLLSFDGTTFRSLLDPLDSHLPDQPVLGIQPISADTLAILQPPNLVTFLGKAGQLLGRTAIDGRFGPAPRAFSPGGGELWIATKESVQRLRFPYPVTVFDSGDGLEGSILSLCRQGGDLLVGTDRGLFRLQTTPAGHARFHRINSQVRQYSALLATREGLLNFDDQGLYLTDASGRSTLLGPAPHPFAPALLRSQAHPDIIYCRNHDRVTRLVRTGDTWTFASGETVLPSHILQMAEDEDGSLWCAIGRGRMARIVDAAHSPQVEVYGSGQGLPTDCQAGFLAIGNKVRFLSSSGVYRFDAKDRAFFYDPTGTGWLKVEPSKVLRAWPENAGGAWLHTNEGNARLHPSPEGSHRWEPLHLTLLGNLPIGQVFDDANGVVWLANDDRLYRYDPSLPVGGESGLKTLLRGIQTIGREPIYAGFGPLGSGLELPYSQGVISFQCALPACSHGGKIRYQAILEGKDEMWTPWSPSPRFEYAQLPPGAYTFRVRAQTPCGETAEEASYAFSIATPLHRSVWAYLIYAGGLLLLVLGAARLRSWRYETRNRQLEETVRRRTETIEAQAAELQTRAAHLIELNRKYELANMELSAANEETQAMNQSLVEANQEITNVNLKMAETNLALEQTNRRLEALNKEKNEFIGIATHDLKNPLAAIRGLTDISLDPETQGDAEALAENMREIQGVIERMTAIITNLLDINRIEQGRLDLDLAPCDAVAAARSVCQDYERRAADKGIRLSFSSSADRIYIQADASVLRQVMDNLVSNAVKYSPRGRRVWITLASIHDRVSYSVRDEGPGLSEEDQKKLFGKFARLSPKPTGGESSNGLGLAIVKRLVEAMHGTVRCETELGRGADFIAEFPRLPGSGASQHPDGPGA